MSLLYFTRRDICRALVASFSGIRGYSQKDHMRTQSPWRCITTSHMARPSAAMLCAPCIRCCLIGALAFRQGLWYTRVPVEECINAIGKKPIGFRWVDISKHDVERHNTDQGWHRHCQDCARSCFHWNLLRSTISSVMDLVVAQAGEAEDVKLTVCQRAHFDAPSIRAVYVKMADEAYEEGGEFKWWKFNVPMYWARNAALNWHQHYTRHLKSLGFRRGIATPCVFQHPGRGMRWFVPHFKKREAPSPKMAYTDDAAQNRFPRWGWPRSIFVSCGGVYLSEA